MPIRVDIEKLKDLIELSFGTDENPWISKKIVDEAHFDLTESTSFSRKWSLDALQYREMDENEIETTKNFLQNLEKTQAKTYLCHFMVEEESGRRYEISTDPEINELIGIRRFPVPRHAEAYSVRVTKVKNLLAKSYGSVENPWISRVEAEKADIRAAAGDGGPLTSLQSIYERRGWMNDERGNGIEGFDRLLENFKTTQAKEVLVHSAVDSNQREYALFTDPAINDLFGILRFPEGWANRPSGLDSLKAPRE